jgi:hypothetical protein
MRALFLLALVSLTARADDSPGRFARFCDRTAQGRTTRGLQCDDLAFFEFAPSGGAGMGAVAPYPNWLLQSEDFATTWAATNDATGTTAPTVTANFATDPLGGNTADRVQVASCLTAGWISKVQQAITTPSGGAGTFTVYVKGNGTSGTLSLCSYTTTGTCTSCAYTASAWARCTHSVAATSAVTTYVNAGCTNNVGYSGGVASAAQDVLLWGAQLDYGGGATYVATTTAAKGFTPTGARGETLTFTRASTAMAQATAGGGLATTGIQNGDLRLMPANQPRVSFDANGTLGLLVESSRTNSALRSQESGNAVWQALSSGVAAPVVTADTAVAPDGTTTADTAAFPAVSVAANYSDLLQNITLTAASWTYSEFVKGVSGSGRLYVMCTPDGVTYFRSACDYNSTTWTRCAATGTATALGWFCGLGVDLRDGSQAAQGAQSVYRWGMQAEAGAYATSYIPTVAATVTRSAETATFPGASFPVSPISIAVSYTVPWSGTATAGDLLYGNVGSNSGWTFGWTGATLRTQPCAAGLCATFDVAQGPTAGVTARWALSYSAGATSIYRDAVLIAGPAVRTAAVSPWATATGVGSGGFGPGNGIITRICIDPSDTRCR